MRVTDFIINEILNNTCDMVTRDNESPSVIPDFLTRRIPSRSAANQLARDKTIPLTLTYLQENKLLEWP